MKHPTLLSMLRSVSFITTVFIFIFIFIISSPTSHGAEEDSDYSNCKKTYNCGEQIKEIGYPFSGGARPSQCGVQGFELTCHDNYESTTIVMDNLEFWVLHISQSTHNMIIGRTDMLVGEDICHFPNTTLNFNLFDYSHLGVENISLSYGCPRNLVSNNKIPYQHQFKCPSIDDESTTSFFQVVNDSFVSVDECKNSVRVPVFREHFDAFLRGEYESLQQVVKEGFGVEYHEMEHFKACGVCNSSGGVCGTNTQTNQPTCYCPNGPPQSLACRSPSPSPNPNQGHFVATVASVNGVY